MDAIKRYGIGSCEFNQRILLYYINFKLVFTDFTLKSLKDSSIPNSSLKVFHSPEGQKYIAINTLTRKLDLHKKYVSAYSAAKVKIDTKASKVKYSNLNSRWSIEG